MRPALVAGVFVAGVGVGAGGCFLYLRSQSPTVALQPVPGQASGKPTDAASVLRYHSAFKFGVPVTDALRFYEGYVSDWDFRTRNPKWVFEHLTQESLAGDAERGTNGPWHEDVGVDPAMRTHLQDFRNTGYDRGHMAAAANHKRTQAEQDETFCLSNICPQVGAGFNRDYWARFEKFCRSVTKHARDVYVVTGPLWLPTQDPSDGKWTMRYPLIGEAPHLVAVPTHFYKVIMADNRKGGSATGPVGVAAFVMPNAPIEEHKPLSAFVVPLADLEAVAGVNFFPGFIDPKRRRTLDQAAETWSDHGLQQLKPFERLTMQQGVAALRRAKSLPAGQAASAAPPKPPKKKDAITSLPGVGGGDYHLCDVAACTMPRAEFFKAGKAAAAAAAAGAGGTARTNS